MRLRQLAAGDGALENWLHHELRVYQKTQNPDLELSFWRTSSQIEVDFIVSYGREMLCAIEAKATERVRSDHLKGLHELKRDYPKLQRRIVVCLEKTVRRTEEGIEMLPYFEFIKRLWEGSILESSEF